VVVPHRCPHQIGQLTKWTVSALPPCLTRGGVETPRLPGAGRSETGKWAKHCQALAFSTDALHYNSSSAKGTAKSNEARADQSAEGGSEDKPQLKRACRADPQNSRRKHPIQPIFVGLEGELRADMLHACWLPLHFCPVYATHLGG
jgi:hypothetical protein